MYDTKYNYAEQYDIFKYKKCHNIFIISLQQNGWCMFFYIQRHNDKKKQIVSWYKFAAIRQKQGLLVKKAAYIWPSCVV